MHLTRKDIATIAGLVIAWVVAVLLSHRLAAGWTSVVAVGLAMTFVVAALYEVYRRLAGALRHYHDEPSVNYRQIESLFSLFASLPIRHPLPPMRVAAASPDFANTLVGLIRELRPQTVVELGSGLSTLIAAYGLSQNGEGRIMSLEQDDRYAEITRSLLAERGLQEVARVVHAPLREINLKGRSWLWYDTRPLADLESVDLLVVDGPLQQGESRRTIRYPALPLLIDKLGRRAVVLMDDGLREDERGVAQMWAEEFPQFERRDVPSEKGTIILTRRG